MGFRCAKNAEPRVQLYRLSPDGRKLTIKILEPMTFFGEMAILGQGILARTSA